ncbi:MAG: hypothetical protein NC935_03775 [Candidatus Omnitrophica bacterium]|nr:hypothetical protein [Candidatus Omnitrophota bacterium]
MNNQTENQNKSFLKRFFLNKLVQKVLFILIVLWFIFSVVYIGYDQFNKFLIKLSRNAYTQGFADSINAIINQTDNCQTVRVYYGNREKTLIDVKCINATKVLNNQPKPKK